MRAPLSWIRDYVDLPADVSVEDLAARLTGLGLKLEALEHPGSDITGPLVVGRVLRMEPEPQKNGKTINWCTVDVGPANGTGEPQGIVCGAHNFVVGDLVVVVLPGGVLPGGFEISERKTYGHLSAGMICSAKELGLGDDAGGIVVLPVDAGSPGDSIRDFLLLDDDVIEFEINPDRSYALSLRGVAREAALATGAPYVDPALRETPTPNADGYPVVIADPVGCPVFVARTVSGFDPTAPTPRWMARRIQHAGMRPISLAVDVTNYVMLELGHPIHGYDADKLTGPIKVRRASQGEKLTTLDGAERTLAGDDLVVTDDTGPIGLGGVMGGQSTEISGSTTRILIEVASWNPVAMFRTGKRHKLNSEAGKRNERGVDPTIPEAAADRVVELLVTHGGATADAGVTKVGLAPISGAVKIAADLPARITGMAIDAMTTVANLEAVGCSVSGTADLTVVPPPWRPDITDPFDLVEEVARIVGYHNVPSVLPPAPAGRGLTFDQQLRRRVGRTLAGAGFVEVLTFPFVGTEAFDALAIPADDVRRTALRLANPLSAEAPLMTTTLLPGMLEALARNIGRGAGDLALFEAAPVTLPRVGAVAPILSVERRPDAAEWAELNAALPAQPVHLSLALAGDRELAGWWGPGRAVSWSDAVQGVRQVADAVGVELVVRAATQAPWHPGRCAELLVATETGERSLGFAGELHPRVCTATGVPARTAVAEIDLSALIEHAVGIVAGPTFSTYPVAKEDVALLVADSVPAASVAQTLREGAGELCESVRLFDVYTGAQVGEGKRSLAFALRFRAPDRTLTDAETAEARDAAVLLVAQRHSAVQR
jgi:phenylalanyl-tRNA synthetase beta chain